MLRDELKSRLEDAFWKGAGTFLKKTMTANDIKERTNYDPI